MSIGQRNVAINEKIINYLNPNEVLKFKKLEVGIVLPNDLRSKVENFTQKRRGSLLNPYLEWEIKVFIEFIPPNSKKSIFIDGFYYKDYKSFMSSELPEPANKNSYSNEEYANLGEWTEQKSDYHFRVRFSPDKVGDWMYKIHIKTKDDEIVSPLKSFKVIPSDSKGYISIGRNRRYLELNDSTFYPIGGNIPWPATYEVIDKEFALKNNYQGKPFPEDYRTVPAAPRVYSVYKNILSNVADNGVNMVRMIMYPSTTDIEWENLGDYTDRLTMSKELDNILELAEEKGVYLLWNLQIHYSFQESVEAYYKQWAWDTKTDGQAFCYRELIDSENPIDFFSHTEAKKYYKQRLRYIISRWGYSTNIGVFELFSEINNVVEPGTNGSLYYKTNDNWKLFTSWQKEMSNYISSHHNGAVHLQTTSYAGDKQPDDTVFLGKQFDIMSTNNYDIHAPSFGKFWVNNVAKTHLNEANPDSYVQPKYQDKREVKPLIYSETGVLSLTQKCNYNSIEINRHLYQSIFSGVAGAFDWDLWFLKDFTEYQKAHDFISKYQLDAENWHPGASKLVPVKNDVAAWEFQSRFSERMEGKNSLADLSYLRSGDKSKAIGVLTNKTYNVYSVLDCFDKEWDKKVGQPGWEAPISTIQTVRLGGRKGEKLKIKGMKNAQYIIDYFLPSNLENPIHTSYDMGPTVKIETVIGNTNEEYIVLFKMRTKKSLQTFK